MARKKPAQEELTVPQSEEEDGLLIAQVCRRLDCSKRKVRKLVEEGKLTVTVSNGFEYFDETEVADLLEEGFTGNKKDVAFDQTVKALKDSHDHLNRFVSLVIDPLQKTNDALLSENRSLRENQDKLYSELRQVNELYGALQRETIDNEIAARKEELNIAQRKEAFDMVRNSLMPAIVENMSAKRILGSLDDTMIETLIASELLTPEQLAFMTSYLKRRKESAASKAEESSKKNGSSQSKAES